MHVVAPLMPLSEHHMRRFHAVGAPAFTPMHVCVTSKVMEPIEFRVGFMTLFESNPSLGGSCYCGIGGLLL